MNFKLSYFLFSTKIFERKMLQLKHLLNISFYPGQLCARSESFIKDLDLHRKIEVSIAYFMSFLSNLHEEWRTATVLNFAFID